MLKTLILAFVVMLSARAVEAKTPPDFRSIVPSDWTLLPPDKNSHERRFVSPAGDAWLSLYAQPTRLESVSAHMERVKFMPGEEITYERQGQGWLVVSGYKGNRIFYRKAMLACGNRQWHHLAFEYPAEEKRAFDRFVTRASYALKEYELVGCGA
jgi:serine/threonine-protein kinase